MPTDATTTTTHPVVTATTGLFMVMQAAEIRRLPMPFDVRADRWGTVQLQFHAHAEVLNWATSLGEHGVTMGTVEHAAGTNDWTRVTASWFDVDLVLVASVPRKAASS